MNRTVLAAALCALTLAAGLAAAPARAQTANVVSDCGTPNFAVAVNSNSSLAQDPTQKLCIADGKPITGATLSSGGEGIVGWLSQIWTTVANAIGLSGATAPASAIQVGAQDGSGNLQPASPSHPLPVSLASAPLPSGAATAANQSSQLTQETSTATNTGTTASNTTSIATNTGTAATNTGTIHSDLSTLNGAVATAANQTAVQANAGTVAAKAVTETPAPNTASGIYSGCTVGTTAAACTPNNTPKVYLELENESQSATVCVDFGGTATISSGVCAAGELTLLPLGRKVWEGDFVPTDTISLIASAASTPVTIGAK